MPPIIVPVVHALPHITVCTPTGKSLTVPAKQPQTDALREKLRIAKEAKDAAYRAYADSEEAIADYDPYGDSQPVGPLYREYVKACKAHDRARCAYREHRRFEFVEWYGEDQGNEPFYGDDQEVAR